MTCRKWVRWICVGIIVSLVLWLIAFAWCAEEQLVTFDQLEHVDAIVVFAGGNNRIQKGLDALEEGIAPMAFISGVHRATDFTLLLQLFQKNASSLPCCIDYESIALNTRQNAEQTALWVKKHDFSHVMLVTSDYHMVRSLLELKAVIPDVKITPVTVRSRQFIEETWWSNSILFWIRFSEFNKILFTKIRLALR